MVNASNTTVTKHKHHILALLMLIYFFSGLCSLIDQVVWVRLLKTTLGNTVYASSIVVSVFMGGLALGALISGRIADRVKHPLRVYAILEVGATASALAVPYSLRIADVFYKWIYANTFSSSAILLFIQILISALLILIPTMVMGSTLPLLGRFITASNDHIGRMVGRLYFINTFGAAIGCFLAGFLLVRYLGVMGSLYLAAGFNLLVALGGFVLSIRFAQNRISQGARMTELQMAPGTSQLPGKRYVLITAIFMSGFISIGYELVWMRGIIFQLGGFTYVFAAVLTIYLLGNVIGVWIGSVLSRRFSHHAVPFSITLTFLGAFGVLFVAFYGYWFNQGPFILQNLLGLAIDQQTPFSWAFYILLNSSVLFLLPSITMGIGFPFALQAWARYVNKVGQTTGTVYGINTIGAVLGGVVSGFILIPHLGIQGSIISLGVLGVFMGFGLFLMFAQQKLVPSRLLYYAAVGALLVGAVLLPENLFEQKIIQSKTATTIAVKEGVTTTVSVDQMPDGSMHLLADGYRIAGDDHFRIAQKLLGHLGVLSNKHTQDVLSIGFGSGETTWCLSMHDINKIDCVEIAPELVETALDYFSHINLGNRLDEKVNMIYMDGKNYLYLTQKSYDLIINGANIPEHSGSAPLFTKEHFQNALDHLNPHGIFLTKLHIYDIAQSSFDSILGTFLEVFPHATMWYPTTRGGAFFYLMGSKDPQTFSPAYIENQLALPAVNNSVDYIRFANSHHVLSCYIGDKNDLQRYLKSYQTNSDRVPFLEFNFDQTRYTSDAFYPEIVKIIKNGSIFEHIDWTGMSEDNIELWKNTHKTSVDVSHYVLKAYPEEDIQLYVRHLANAYRIDAEFPAVQVLDSEFEAYAHESLKANPKAAGQLLQLSEQMLEIHPEYGTAYLVQSWALQALGEMEQAIASGEKATELAPNRATAFENLALLHFYSDEYQMGMPYINKAIQLSPENTKYRLERAKAQVNLKRYRDAFQQFQTVIQIEPANTEAHYFLGEILYLFGEIEQAKQAFRHVLQLDPEYANTRTRIKQVLAMP